MNATPSISNKEALLALSKFMLEAVSLKEDLHQRIGRLRDGRVEKFVSANTPLAHSTLEEEEKGRQRT